MAYLLHSDFFCSTPWGVIYVLYIINTFIAHFSIKIIPRIIAVTTLFSGICPYIINTFFLPFTPIGYRSLPCLSAPFFRYLCPLYYQYCNWENSYKNNTAVRHVCQHLFTRFMSLYYQ